MRIEVYLDGAAEPFQTLAPPEKFRLETAALADGPHELAFKAIDDDGTASVRLVTFTVQNGPGIAVHGIVEGDTLSGDVSILTNAYGSRIGDEFEPVQMETPTPVPTWAWVLCLIILAWGAGYLSLELRNRIDTIVVHKAAVVTTAPETKNTEWAALGEQIYGNNCSSCHQSTGTGLPGVFPPLAGNPAVLDDDASTHIRTVLNGVANKVIDGVAYAAPMPPFGSLLSDEEVAAVVNHERTLWGNNAAIVAPEDVAALR
jgi:mono/diheme cytochrome c family protein